jgi:hypothetical protein
LHGNGDEGHAAEVGDPDATEVPVVDLKYAGSSDDGGFETATDPAVMPTAAAANTPAIAVVSHKQWGK